jgi:hypothetical protein
MILSAMMFALGFVVSGLAWLALSVALVRRARRLTARRLLAGIATRRAEFEAERDELRARHAVEMHRLEREVGRVVDMATAHRLEADIKERDLVSAKADLAGRDDDLQETLERLAEQRELVQDLERRHAEAGAELRAVQHALKLEMKRRAMAEEALDDANILADQRRLELAALRAENDAMRAETGEVMPFEQPDGTLPRIVQPAGRLEAAAAQGASVVQLKRPRHTSGPAETPDALVAEAARDLQRLAVAAQADPGSSLRPVPAPEPHLPAARAPGDATIAELSARRSAAAERAMRPEAEEVAETRFLEALAEIRALKRSAGQAGE